MALTVARAEDEHEAWDCHLVSLCALATVAYFTASKWAIRHETLTFYDASRR